MTTTTANQQRRDNDQWRRQTPMMTNHGQTTGRHPESRRQTNSNPVEGRRRATDTTHSLTSWLKIASLFISGTADEEKPTNLSDRQGVQTRRTGRQQTSSVFISKPVVVSLFNLTLRRRTKNDVRQTTRCT